jgi:uncharacterized membrane protein
MVVEIYCFKTRINTKNQIIKTQKNLLFNITKLKVNKMKTIYTTMAILAIALSSQTAAAKLGANRSTSQLESKIEVDVKAEIVNNINKMLANVKAPAIKTEVAKQLNLGTVQFQTNELVQNVAEKLPEFKFKVVLTD